MKEKITTFYHALFYTTIGLLFLKPEFLSINTKWLSASVSGVKNILLPTIVLWLVLRVWKKAPRLQTPPLMPAMALLAIPSLLSTICSPYPAVSWEATGVLVVYILFYCMCYDMITNTTALSKIIHLALATGLLAGSVNFLYRLRIGIGSIIDNSFVSYPFWEGKNIFGMFVLCVIFLGLSLIFTYKRQRISLFPDPLLILGTGCCVLAMLFNYSRETWIAFVVGLALFALLRWGMKTGLILCILATLVIGGAAMLSERLPDLWRFKDPNIQKRLVVWKAATDMSQKHPWLGTGTGTFRHVFDEHYKPKDIKKHIIQWGFHAHNLYLHVAAENGIPALVGLLGIMGYILIRGVRQVSTLKRRLLTLANDSPHITQLETLTALKTGAISAYSAFLVFSLFDTSFVGVFGNNAFFHLNLVMICMVVVIMWEEQGIAYADISGLDPESTSG